VVWFVVEGMGLVVGEKGRIYGDWGWRSGYGAGDRGEREREREREREKERERERKG
jgi:hypothetical protein